MEYGTTATNYLMYRKTDTVTKVLGHLINATSKTWETSLGGS